MILFPLLVGAVLYIEQLMILLYAVSSEALGNDWQVGLKVESGQLAPGS